MSNQNLTYNIETSGGAQVSGLSNEIFIYNIETSGVAQVSGLSNEIFIYNIDASNGIEISGYYLQNSTYNLISSSGIQISGTISFSDTRYPEGGVFVGGLSIQDFNDIIDVNGGSKASGLSGITFKYTIRSSGGVKISGKSSDNFNSQIDISGGVILAGPSPITINVSGGIKVGSESIIFVSVTKCDIGFKCGGLGEDQYCAQIEQIQGASSKFLNPQRKNPLASCFQSPYMEQKSDKSLSANFKKKDSDSAPNCFGSSAFVAAITLCQQNIKPKPSNKKHVSKVKKLTIQATENIQMLATTAIDAKEFKENKNKKVVSNVKDTPQMENLKEISKNVVQEKVLIKQVIEDKPKAIKVEKPVVAKETTFLATNKFDKKEIKNNAQIKVRSNIKDTPQMIELNKISSDSSKIDSSIVTKDRNIVPLKIASKREVVVKNKIKSQPKLQSNSLNSKNQEAL